MIGAVVTVILFLVFGWLLFDKDDWGKPME
jgi:hypothetical protein